MMGMGATALGATAELIVALKLKNEISGPLHDAERQLAGLNRQSTTLGGGLHKIGAGLVTGVKVAAAAAIGLGTAVGAISLNAVNEATQFQADMEMIHTQAHASQQEVAAMTQALIAMAGQVGSTPEELAAGLYHLESAGFRGAQALDALRIAAEGAKVGHANLEDVTNALDAVLVAGGKDAQDMSGSMGQLNAIVGAGDMRMQDLADAMGTGILGVAHTFGLRLTDIGAALAVFGDNNIRGSDAATKLRQAITMLGAPSGAAAKHLATIGLSSIQLADDMRNHGLLFALTDLKKHLEDSGLTASQQAEVIARSFGGGRTGAGIMLLLDQLTRLQSKEKDVADGAGAFGADWAAQQQTVQQAKDNMAAAFDALRLQLGTELLPVAANVMQALAKFFQDPTTISAVKDFGAGLASMFSPANLAAALKFAQSVIPRMKEFASQILPPLVAGMKIAGSVGKEAFDMFNALPSGVQSVVIAALAGNKLTGGLVSSGIADLGKLLIGAFRSAATAEMNVTAAVVNVAGGGIPGGGGGGGEVTAAETAAGAGLGKLGILKFALRSLGLGAGLGLLAVNNAAGPNGGLNASGFVGNIAGGTLAGASIAGPFGALAGGLVGIAKGIQEQESSHNAAMASGISDTITKLIASHATPDQLQAALDATNQGIDRLNDFAGPLSGIANAVVGGGALDQLKADRDALLKAVSAAQPNAVGEHSAAGARQVSAINAMSNLLSKNLLGFRAGERADIASVVKAQQQTVVTAERKGNEMNAAIGTLQSRLQGSVQIVGDAIRHLPPPQVHVAAPVVSVAVATTVSVRDQTVKTSQYYRYGRANAV